MLKHFSASLRLGAILLAACSLQAAEPLVWKWGEGDEARYLTSQTMRMTMDAGPAGKLSTSTKHDTVMSWVVESVGDGGAAKLRQETERIVMKNQGPMGQGFEYDSDDAEPPAGMAALVAPMFEAMVEHPFMMTMLPSGEITDIELSDELSEAFDRLPGGAVSGEMVGQMTRQGSLRFPAELLAVGDTWTNTIEINTPQMGPMKVLTTYVYEGPREVDGHEYEAFTPAVKIEAVGGGDQASEVSIETKSSTGEILFDRKAGRVFRSRVLQTMEVQVQMGDQQVTNEVEQAVEMRQLGADEAPSLEAKDPSLDAKDKAPADKEPALTE